MEKRERFKGIIKKITPGREKPQGASPFSRPQELTPSSPAKEGIIIPPASPRPKEHREQNKPGSAEIVSKPFQIFSEKLTEAFVLTDKDGNPTRYTQITDEETTLSYLVNDAGEKVSPGFHDFFLLTITEKNKVIVQGIIAEKGSMKYALRFPTENNPHFMQSEEGFHEFSYRPDLGGLFVARIGSTIRIVDAEGNFISKKYNEIFSRGGKLYGKIGSGEGPKGLEEISLPSSEEAEPDKRIIYEPTSDDSLPGKRKDDELEAPGEYSSSDEGDHLTNSSPEDPSSSADFFTATDVTKPFWEREAALDRMGKRGGFWAKDPTLPFWIRNR